MRSRKNRSPEEQARRAKTRELLKKKQTGIHQDTFFKRLYLAMMDITKKRKRRRQDWSVIYAQPAIFFGDRMPE